MSDPLASLLVPHIYQSTDAAITEAVTIPASGPYTYKLGTGLTPAYPANLPLIPSGAAPLNPPPAMTAGATLTTGALATNGNYQWAMTLVTKFGETTPGTILTIAALGTGVTGQTLNLPAGQTGTAAAPVIQRRIWRTKTTGSQLYLVAEIDDANVTTYVDEVSDTLLVTAAPTVNSSGLEGAVALSGTNGAGGSTWTEIAPGASFTTAGQFQVDYTVSATGGVLTFGSLDAGKTPTANYTAAALLGSAYFALVQAALTTLHSFGIVQLSPTSPQTGDLSVTGVVKSGGGTIRRSVRYDMDADASGDLTVDYSHQNGNRGLFSDYGNPLQLSITTTGGDLDVTFSGWPWSYSNTTGNWCVMAVSLDAGPAYVLASAGGGAITAAYPTLQASGGNAAFSGTKVFRGVTAGTHTVYLLLQSGGGTGLNPASGFKKGSSTSWFSATIHEIG